MTGGRRLIRWGIVGAGGIAHTVGRVIAASAGSEVAAVAARDRVRARRLATELGAPLAFGHYEQLFGRPEIDVVYVATVHTEHYAHASAALAAGHAVLVEKPLTLTADEAQRLTGQARRSARFLAEAVWTRYLPVVRDAVAAADGGVIGDVIGVQSTLARHVPFDPAHRLWDPTVGGGVLFDLGGYVAHLAELFVGRPERVHVTGRRASNGVESTVAMQWSCRDDRYAQLVASFDGWSGEPRTVVVGGAGAMSFFGPTQAPTRVDVTGPGRPTHSFGPADRPTGYLPQIAEVERCLAAGELETPLAPLDTSAAVIAVLAAAQQTLRRGLGDGGAAPTR